MVLAEGRIWVSNEDGNYMSELDATSGALVRTIRGSDYRFNRPLGVTTDGRSLWVTNSIGNSITEVNATNGSLVRVIRPPRIRFTDPEAIAYAAGHLWVASGGNVGDTSAVVELSASNGRVVRVVRRDIWSPKSIDVVGQHVWVGNLADARGESTGDPTHSVTELNEQTGAVEQSLNLVHLGSGVEAAAFAPDGANLWFSNGNIAVPGTNYQAVEIRDANGRVVRRVGGTHTWSNGAPFAAPAGVVLRDGHLWIADGVNVVEIRAATGGLIRIIGAPQYRFDGAQDLITVGDLVWISNTYNNYLTELRLSTGALVRVVK
jgi:DNA-binding beta-propeller fold protein YncE